MKDKDSAAHCDICQFSVHINCNKLNNIDHKYLQGSDDHWYFISCCNKIFPLETLAKKNFLSMGNSIPCDSPSTIKK